MFGIARRGIALLSTIALLLPSFVGCSPAGRQSGGVDEESGPEDVRTVGQEATTGPAPLPAYTYVPPSAPDFAAELSVPYAPLAPDGHQSVGKIPGTSHVGIDGSFSYSMPIRVPAGVNGLTPNLALSYNSRAPDGPLGVGFRIEGLSKIERCKKVLAVEDTIAEVEFKHGHEGDSFCLDGKKLMLATGNPGEPNSTYRTEVADYSVITLDGANQFVIQGADGLKRTYLAQPDLKQESWESNHYVHPDGPAYSERPLLEGFVWNLKTITDHFGNSITIDYVAFDNISGTRTEWLPEKISYGNGRQVRFFYSPQYPQESDAIQRCVSGVCFSKHFQLLDRVEILFHDDLQWQYNVEYDSSRESGRKRIASVEWCGPQGECLPKTEFHWETEMRTGTAQLGWRRVWASEPQPVSEAWFPVGFLADIDGDGRDDLIYQSQVRGEDGSDCPDNFGLIDRQRAYFQRSRGFFLDPNSGDYSGSFEDPINISDVFDNAPGSRKIAIRGTRFADFNNDGGQDILGCNAAGVEVTRCRYMRAVWDPIAGKPKLDPASSPFHLPYDRQLEIGDADGNGLPDRFFTGPRGGLEDPVSMLYQLTRPTGSAGEVTLDPPVVDPANCYGDSFRRVADIDGDGRNSLGCFANGYAGNLIGPDNEDWAKANSGAAGAFYADVNGDGLGDGIYTEGDGDVFVSISTGNGYRAAYSAGSFGFDVNDSESGATVGSIGDFNGDGRADLIAYPSRGGTTSGLCWRIKAIDAPPTILLSQGEVFRRWEGFDGGDLFLDESRFPRGRHLSKGPSQVVTPDALAVGDVNGDGISEFLVFNVDDSGDARFMLFALTQKTGPITGQFSPIDGPGDLLVGVRNSYFDRQAEETIQYGSIAQADEAGDDLYKSGSDCVWPQRCLKSGLQVVQSYSGQASSYRTWDYRYEDARTDLGGRGFLGFKCITRIEEESKEVVKTCFDNKSRQAKAGPGWIYPFAQLPSFQETRTPIDSSLSKVRVTRSDFIYRNPRWMTNAVYTVEKEKQYTRVYEGVPTSTDLVHAPSVHTASPLFSTNTESFTQDSYGNEVQYHSIVDARGERHQTDVFRTFQNETGTNYRIGLLRSEEVQKQRGEGANMRKRLAEMTYDAHRSLVTHVTQSFGGADQKRTLLLNRDPTFGTVRYSEVSVAGMPTARTSYEYDDDHVHLRKITNPLGHVAWVGMHPALGLPVVTRNANGLTRNTRYDFTGRVSYVYGDGPDLYYSYGRDDYASSLGLNDSTSHGTFAAVRLGGTSLVVAGYDARDRISATYEKQEDGRFSKQRQTYDEDLGFVRSISLPYFDNASAVPYSTQTHDLLGRTLSVTRPDDSVEFWTYPSPYETRHTDPTNRTTITRSDVAGLLAEHAELNGSTEVKTKYRYYPFGELRDVTFASGSRIDYEIDDLGRRTKTVDPDSGVEYNYYNALGLVRQSKRGGQPNDNSNLTYTVDDKFDILGRVTESKTSCLAGSDCRAETRRFTYDQGYYAAGHLVRAESVADAITTTISYGSDALPYDIETFIDGETFLYRPRRGDTGQLSSLLYPQAPGAPEFKVYFEKDPSSRLQTIRTLAGETFYEVDERAPEGFPTRIHQEFFGGTRVERAIQLDPLTRNVTNMRSSTPSAPHLGSHEYTYYANGLLQTASDYGAGFSPTPVETQSYEYDYAARLTAWTRGNERTSYQYTNDSGLSRVETRANGVVTSSESYVYGSVNGAGLHGVTARGNEAFSYDKSGRLNKKTANGTQTFLAKYTDQDLPREITTGTGTNARTVKFRYDAFGNRVVKSAPGADVITVGPGYERRKTTGAGAGTTHIYRIHADGELIAEQRYTESTGAWEKLYVHRDRLGSTALVLNANGTVKERVTYDPWGKRREPAAPAIPSTRIGFTGHEHDDDLGLINMGGRIYDPSLRVVLTPDPLASAPSNAGIHPYAYAMQNPVNATDPSGFEVVYEDDDGTMDCGDWGGDFDSHTTPGESGKGHAQKAGAEGSVGSATAATAAAEAASQAGGGGGGGGLATGGIGGPSGELGVPGSVGSSDGFQTSPTFQSSAYNSGFGVSAATHVALAGAGFVPGVGAIADILDAGLYAYEGSWADAGWSLVAAVPGIGDSVAALKGGAMIAGGLGPLLMGLRAGNAVGDAGRGAGSLIRGLGNIGSHGPMKVSDALASAEKWLGKGYKEIGPSGSGVFRSADGARQFRMTAGDLNPLGHGAKSGLGSHVHFEALDEAGRIVENLHIPLAR